MLQSQVNGGDAGRRIISKTSVGNDQRESKGYFSGGNNLHTYDSDCKCKYTRGSFLNAPHF